MYLVGETFSKRIRNTPCLLESSEYWEDLRKIIKNSKISFISEKREFCLEFKSAGKIHNFLSDW